MYNTYPIITNQDVAGTKVSSPGWTAAHRIAEAAARAAVAQAEHEAGEPLPDFHKLEIYYHAYQVAKSYGF